MSALPGLLGVIMFTYIRPQEFVPAISGIPWINLWLLLMVGGFAIDWFSGKLRKEATPLFKWSVIFYVWCFFTLAMKMPGEISGKFTFLTTGVGLSLIIQHAVQNAKAFMRVTVVVFVTSM